MGSRHWCWHTWNSSLLWNSFLCKEPGMQIKHNTTWSRMVLLMLGAALVGCWFWLLADVVWNGVPRSGDNSGAVASPSLRGTSGGDAAMGCALLLSCLIHAPGLPLKYFKDKCLKEPQTKTQSPASSPKKANLRKSKKISSTTQNSWRWMFWSDCCCFTASVLGQTLVSSSGSWSIFAKWKHEAGPCGRAQ